MKIDQHMGTVHHWTIYPEVRTLQTSRGSAHTSHVGLTMGFRVAGCRILVTGTPFTARVWVAAPNMIIPRCTFI